MVSTAVIVLSVSTSVLAVGFLSSLTALLTLKYETKPDSSPDTNTAAPTTEDGSPDTNTAAPTTEDSSPDTNTAAPTTEGAEPAAAIPDFFLPHGPDAGDSIVNGSDSRWLSPRSTFEWDYASMSGQALITLDALYGKVTIELADIKSGSMLYAADIYVNNRTDTPVASEDDYRSYVWVRITTNEAARQIIDAAVNNSIAVDWAFVATWIDFGGSTFQFVFAFEQDDDSVSICNYGVLSENDRGNQFCGIHAMTYHPHDEATDLPSNKQLTWLMSLVK